MRGYLATLRSTVDVLWLSIFPALTALIVNVAIPGTSQGAELLSALADSPHRAASLAILLAAASYCAASCWISSAVVLRCARRDRAQSSRVAPARALVPYWLAAAVSVSCTALVLPLPFVSLGVPVVLAATFLALPFAARAMPVYRPLPRFALIGGALGLFAIGAVTGVAVTLAPVTVSRALGAWALVYLGLGCWTLVAETLFVAWPKRVGLPALMFLPLLAFVAFSRTNDNHAIRVRQALRPADIGNDARTMTLRDRFAAWTSVACAVTRNPADMPGAVVRDCPVILVAAEGGGTRAAYWTASVLQDLDRASRGAFARHLFAISAVSGGALGAASFVAAKADERAGSAVDTTRALREVLAQDDLSPIVGALLFPDLLQRFLPVAIPRFDRAVAFETALESSWSSAFGSRRFAEDLSALYAGTGGAALPSLFLNATNVETGKRFVISNVSLDRADRGDAYYAYDPQALYRITSMPLSTAVHLTARFPYVSPHGVLYGRSDSRSHTEPWGRIVDGAYYENSGAATLADLYDALIRDVAKSRRRGLAATIRPRFIVVVITSTPDVRALAPATTAPDLPRRPMAPLPELERATNTSAQSLQLSELLTPVQALFDARGAHAAAAVQHLEERVRDAQPGARNAFVKISYADIAAGDRLERVMRAMNGGKMDARSLIELIQPGLGWSLSPRSRHALDILSRVPPNSPLLRELRAVMLPFRARIRANRQLVERCSAPSSCVISAATIAAMNPRGTETMPDIPAGRLPATQ